MDYVQITRDRIAGHTQNLARRLDSKTTYKSGMYTVTSKSSGRIIAQGSESEIEKVFFDYAPVGERAWEKLRESCIVDPYITPSHLIRLIRDNNLLKVFVENIDPNYLEDKVDTASESISFFRTISVEKGKLSIEVSRPNFSFKNDKSYLRFNPNAKFSLNGRCFNVNVRWTFLDVISTVFNKTKCPVIIRKDGIYDESGLVDPFKHLFCECRLDEQVTLKNIFSIVGKDDLLCMFMNKYSWCKNIEIFHNMGDKFVPSELTHLEISHSAGLINDEMHLTPEIQALSPIDSDTKALYEESNAPEFNTHLVSGRAIEEISGLPIVLNENAVFNAYNNSISGQIVGIKSFTLLEILDAIYWEISLKGTTPVKKDVSKVLKNKKSPYWEDSFELPSAPDFADLDS